MRVELSGEVEGKHGSEWNEIRAHAHHVQTTMAWGVE